MLANDRYLEDRLHVCIFWNVSFTDQSFIEIDARPFAQHEIEK